MITALLLYDAAHVGGGPRHVADLYEMLNQLGTGVDAIMVPIYGAGPRDVRWVSRLIRSERADIVHTHAGRSGVAGRIAAALAGVPAVHTWHGFHPERWSIGRHVLERVLRRHTASFIHVSRSSAEHGAKHGFPGVVVPNGIGPAPPPPVDSARGQNTVVAVGRWDDPIKGADVLIKAFDYLDGVRLDMLGVKPRFEIRNGRIWIMGPVSDTAPFLSLANVFASASWGEGCPYAVLEAMRAGLPVVATRVRGHVDLVVDGSTGRLVPPGNAGALALAIDALLKDADRARQIGKAGAERVALHFTLEQMAQGVIEEYRRVIDASATHI